ncbi:MAG: guanylate kinase [Bacteroidia bacterium]
MFYSAKLILFCGPSGSGKTTIVHHLLKNNANLRFSVSATTRPKRENEVDGVDYYFLSVDEFKKKIANDEFVEWEEVYPDGYYGTLKAEIERLVAQNKVVIFDVDVEGGLNIKKIYGDKLLVVFVMPPSLDDLHKRLLARASETEDSLKKRVAKAELELTYADKFNKVIVNDNLETALWHAQKMLDDFVKGKLVV